MLVNPPAGAAEVHAEPLLVNTLPEVEGATAPVMLADVTVVTVAAVPVVFWLNVGQVNVPVLKLPLAGVPNTGATKVVPLGSVGVPDRLPAVVAESAILAESTRTPYVLVPFHPIIDGYVVAHAMEAFVALTAAPDGDVDADASNMT